MQKCLIMCFGNDIDIFTLNNYWTFYNKFYLIYSRILRNLLGNEMTNLVISSLLVKDLNNLFRNGIMRPRINQTLLKERVIEHVVHYVMILLGLRTRGASRYKNISAFYSSSSLLTSVTIVPNKEGILRWSSVCILVFEGDTFIIIYNINVTF